MRRRGGTGPTLMLVGALIGCGASRAADGPAAGSASPAQPATPGQGTGGTPGAAAPPSDSVHIVLTVIPATAKAKVLWGKKLLGVVEKRKPLVIVRPRDSGPIDVVVRADGFLPVQTRLYTFADGKLGVKLTPPEEQKTLLGYREPPPPEPAPGAADGGAGAPIAPAAPNEADAGAPP